ncbi:hypothetical protein HMPREF2128_05420 [Pseudoglutamicibacter albus DNF00011]|uniref:Uncharacterized protein n=1 Tax=Pseudoglutamicibacter albus DNF00011 TaxID=1401063 RepID=A0A095YEG0_9MICC|nr:hypothetical protein HMPREF2128_05420 [Pseudoglutamicibacter albus DNF00011]
MRFLGFFCKGGEVAKDLADSVISGFVQSLLEGAVAFGVPRACGDDPAETTENQVTGESSPRLRG